MEPQDKCLQRIRELTGRNLRAEDWSQQELTQLVALAPLQPPARTQRVPMKQVDRLADPRLRTPAYAQRLWQNPARLSALRLTHQKLRLTVAFECTLVSLAPETAAVSYSQAVQDEVLERLSGRTRRVESPAGRRFVVVERPGASEFLKRLAPVATLFLVSGLQFTLVKKALEALQWQDCFEDVVADIASEKSLLQLFPRYGDNRLCLIFDSMVTSWLDSDRQLLIPSQRFLALERLSHTRLDVRFEVERGAEIEEKVSFDDWGSITVCPDSPQLPSVAKLIEEVALQLFSEQYTRSAAKALAEQTKKRIRVFVHISDLSRQQVARALARAVGMREVEDILQAEAVVVDDCPSPLPALTPARLRSLSFRSVTRTYFNLAED